MNDDLADRELEARLSAAAGPARAVPVEPGALARSVLLELRKRRARRRARASGLGALLLAVATGGWWAQSQRHENGSAPRVTAQAAPSEALAELGDLRQQIELQQWLVASLEQADRCTAYEQRLATLQPIEDPARAGRVELERAAWLMLDDVERRAAAGASLDERRAGYATVSNTLSGTYWAKVADERRQQLTGGTGT